MDKKISLRNELVTRLLLRWSMNAFALWLAGIVISGVSHGNNWQAILTTALLLSAINAVLKPIVIILSLPALLLTLGLFSLVVNGFMVYLASVFVGSFVIASLGGAILAGMVVSLVNYGLTTYLEERIFKEQS